MKSGIQRGAENKITDLHQYKEILKNYSRKVNVISKKITDTQLDNLLNETLMVEERVEEAQVVDAGSGNGLLGIPLAILNPGKKIYLVEPRKKKSEFLSFLKEKLELKNVEVIRSGIEEFVKKHDLSRSAIVARGFPDNEKLISYVKKGAVQSVFLITSMSKIKKLKKGIEKVEQNIYNVPFRDNLKIVSIINVSRETQGENG